MDMLFVRGDGVILVRRNPKTYLYLLMKKPNSFIVDDRRYLPLSEHDRNLSDDGRDEENAAPSALLRSISIRWCKNKTRYTRTLAAGGNP